MSSKAPYKGRPASEILAYVHQCLDTTAASDVRLLNFQTLLVYLLDMDGDCPRGTVISSVSDDPGSSLPESMVGKMDIVLFAILNELTNIDSDTYLGILDIFESVMLKMHHPHFVQYIFFKLACDSKERSDAFLSLLLNIVHDKSADPISRREAIAYVVSFVTRNPDLTWIHSARTGKYLVSFLNTLHADEEAKMTSSDRLLFILCLQALLYLFAWESSKWAIHLDTKELDWVSRSSSSLLSLLKDNRSGRKSISVSGSRLSVGGVALLLIDRDILSKADSVVGRVSMELFDVLDETVGLIRSNAVGRMQVPAVWKSAVSGAGESFNALAGKGSLEAQFLFDPVNQSLLRCSPLLRVREWEEPAPCADAKRQSKNEYTFSAFSLSQSSEEETDELWSFHKLAHTYGASHTSVGNNVLGSPIMEMTTSSAIDVESMCLGPSPVLERIISSERFASR